MCEMEHTASDHRMSDNELRKAIKVMQSRADDATKRGDLDDAKRIERTVHDYQDEMTRRL
ncbi:hypothetical protein GCM10007304_34110 [Rhodococcoides trifolii]|uniref:Uncharacterized protein n=2 Tax=Rhodococcoides trifolii TaxID=908250 RepID=A0A917G0T6_9NOCA|nr:hypothetical protein GCM10007304_34110 [Rhodococcus trifolii]